MDLWLSTWHTYFMTDTTKNRDRHQNPVMATRPDPELRAKTAATLADNDWTMNEFVAACMELVNRNPAAMLKRLAAFKPPRKKGRPRAAKT